jgi:hypothetical protein
MRSRSSRLCDPRLQRRALFGKPLPEVRRVIFIATPQHGSFVAGSAIGQPLAASSRCLPAW